MGFFVGGLRGWGSKSPLFGSKRFTFGGSASPKIDPGYGPVSTCSWSSVSMFHQRISLQCICCEYIVALHMWYFIVIPHKLIWNLWTPRCSTFRGLLPKRGIRGLGSVSMWKQSLIRFSASLSHTHVVARGSFFICAYCCTIPCLSLTLVHTW